MNEANALKVIEYYNYLWKQSGYPDTKSWWLAQAFAIWKFAEKREEKFHEYWSKL